MRDLNSPDSKIERLQAQVRSLSDQLHDIQVRHHALVESFISFKQSFRYQLGSILVDSVTSWRGFLKLPLQVARFLKRTEVGQAVWRFLRTRPQQSRSPAAEARIKARQSRAVVLGIFDKFSYECFRDELEIVPASRNRWRRQLESRRFDFLFVESAWSGNGGDWQYVLSKFDHSGKSLVDLVAACKQRGVPTVFWNKEDPANFDTFIHAARLFDYVFTTDVGCVERYRRECGHDRIHVLPFAAQQDLHNPIADRASVKPRVCFAGSWRGEKYPERVAGFQTVLDAPLEMGVLDIYDRYARESDPSLRFPAKYQKAVLGSLSYTALVKKYREYKAFLNVNSIEESPTMFSRRVFEILACRTPVISTYSVGIEQMLGKAVVLSKSKEETADAVRVLISNPEARDRLGQLGYRTVLAHHTYTDRVDDVLVKIGKTSAKRQYPLVSILCVSNRPEFLDHAVHNIRQQDYTNVEVLFVTNAETFDLAETERKLSVLPRYKLLSQPSSKTLADCLNHALEHAQGEYFAKMDDDDFYGPSYLSDAMLTFSYSDAQIVGKKTYFCYLERSDVTAIRFPYNEFTYVPFVQGATIVAQRKATEKIPFTPVRQGTDTLFMRACIQAKLKIFSSDRFNFMHVRRANLDNHTWKISEDKFLESCVDMMPGRLLDRVTV